MMRMMFSSRCARGRHIEPPLPSEHAFFLQSLAHCDNFWVVDQQERKRHAANLGQRLQLTPIPDKVLRPNVAPGMEQADDLTGFGINASDVRPLETVAVNAGQGEVIKSGCSAMLPRNNVIDLERCGVKGGGQSTVFAARCGALPNLPYEIGVHLRYGAGRCKARRPLDCMTASRFPTWI